ncbi:MAG: DNA polymerase III subunit delta [Lachnospiraceae bacterium]|nr:DNA polymerase III subunit delta [Lachnospiraceae bacterium]
MSDGAFYGRKKEDPQKDIKILNKVIQDKTFSPVHLLYGAEDYLRLQFRDSLCEAMGAVKGSLAFDRFIGHDTDPERIIDLAETLPFMAERRVILVEDTDWFVDSCPEIDEYIDRGVCESTSIVFCEKKADKRLKLYKTVAKCGLISEFPEQTEQTIAIWLTSRLKKLGTPISSNDAAYMVSVAGTDMLALSNECEKLSAYCLEKGSVSHDDIDAICTRRLEDRVFDMCDSIALGNREHALALYYDLIGLKEAPIKILVLITRHFDTLLKIKDLEMRGQADGVICKKVGKPEFTMKKYKRQTGGYSLNELKNAVNLCADADMAVKTGRMSDQISLDTLMVRLTGSRK